MKKLLVVESPAKIAKLKKCLPGFEVVATVGHFQDLPERELGVDVATWTPTYVASKDDIVPRLRAAAKGAEVFLGTDADREGEAIAWHVARVLGLRQPHRVCFREITSAEVQRAVAAPTTIDAKLVDAQQARRIVDRLVGWLVSPLLESLGRHSTGRVQAPTLHLVVEREKARESFTAVPYWTLTAAYAEGFRARAATKGADGKWAVANFKAEAQAQAAQQEAQASPHRVEAIEKRESEVPPPPPFTTSTLTQAANSALRLRPERTMELAQALFEKGVITYHRTDSVALSTEAVEMARAIIAAEYPAALPDAPRVYKAKSGAQEAHEAIRPTASRLPEDVVLSEEEAALHSLISRRFLASQCRPALVATTTIRSAAGSVRFLATGRVTLLHGYLRYASEEAEAEASSEQQAEDSPEASLPKLEEAQALQPSAFDIRAMKTQAPPRFTEASLVKEMDRTGIGRPSTYARTLAVLFEHGYLETEKRFVVPTQRARLLDSALSAALPALLSVDYTAELEAALDRIAEGKLDWRRALTDWHNGFQAALQKAPGALKSFAATNRAAIEQLDEAPKPTGKKCPLCGEELLLRKRRDGKGAFLACSAPGCRYLADPSAAPSALPCPICAGPMHELEGQHGKYARCAKRECKGVVDLSPLTSEACPLCGKPLKDRGAFLACSGHPACTFTRDKKSRLADQKCPLCAGPMLEREGQYGKYARCAKRECKGIVDLAPTTQDTCPRCGHPLKLKGAHLACSAYPACSFMVDAKALERAKKSDTRCPKCGQLMVLRSGQRGPFLACLGFPTCKHTQPVPGKAEKATRARRAS